MQVVFSLAACLAVLLFLTVRQAGAQWRRRAKANRLGCEPPIQYPHKRSWFLDPKGLDFQRKKLQALESGRFSSFCREQFVQLGPTFEQRTPAGRMILTKDRENFRAVLALNFADYNKTTLRSGPALRFIGHGIFTRDGPSWKRSRNLLKPMFRRAELSDVNRLKKHVDRMLAWIPSDGCTVDMAPLLGKLFLDSGTEFVFGETSGALDSASANGDELLAACRGSLFGLSRHRHAVNKPSPAIAKFFSQNVDKVHAFVDKQVARALAPAKAKSFGTTKDVGNRASERYVLLNEAAKQIRDATELRFEMINVFLPAFETTSAVMSNALFHVARNPEIWDELHRQAVELGDQPLTFELLKSLTYFRRVILEALRIHGSSGRTVRTAVCDTVLPRGGGTDGYSPVFVSRGTEVLLDLTSHLNDPDIWGEDAHIFRPDRFESKILKWDFLPFSGGPRVCPAEHQVLTQCVYLLVRLAQEFESMENRDPCITYVEQLKIMTESRNGVQVAWHRRARNSTRV